jgi:L-alanine-DL-glutamate epimerase-like enolase superfamily enzyme
MTTIAFVGVDHYRIPLPVVLSDSTHGDIAEFELVTVRVRDAAGIEGLGYTYTVGRGGVAVAVLIRDDLSPVLLGAEPDRIEALWQRMWWVLHYGGRGGSASLAISAVDIALWDLKARRFGRRCGGYSAVMTRRCLFTLVVSISIFRSISCCIKPTITSKRDSARSR